jgi:hypothetical protein
MQTLGPHARDHAAGLSEGAPWVATESPDLANLAAVAVVLAGAADALQL